MNRARLGALGTLVIAPALLLATGCGIIGSAKDSVDEANNSHDVCIAAIDVYNTQAAKFSKTIAALQAAKPGDPKAAATFTATMKADLGALHDGLAKQAGQAKAADVKKGIEGVDAQVSKLAANPAIITQDQKAGDDLDKAVKAMNAACHATTPTKNPKEK
jgi:hypothetical protein